MQTVHQFLFFQYLARCCLLVVAVAAGGCTTLPASTTVVFPVPDTAPLAAALPPGPSQESVSVVRYGRYTLVELTPDDAQRDLLLQIIDITIPENTNATVGDGLRHVLKRSGYQLCDTASTTELSALPLPAAHLHLGPLTLRDALLTLAGPAWKMEVDSLPRRICFTRHSDTPNASSAGAPGSVPVISPIGGNQP